MDVAAPPSRDASNGSFSFLKLPSWLAAAGFSEGESSRGEEPPKELITNLDAELLRGVPLDVALGKCGTYWEIPESGMLHVDQSLYHLSMPTKQLDNFLSHDWHTSRWLKYLSMLVIFNSGPAALATFIVSVSMGILFAVLDIKGGPHLALPGDVVFLLMFCFWQRLRRLITRRPVMVFMDKLCIAQHDEELKEAGILGLAAFLNCSKRLTILWSPRYFARLWCSFEVATFLNHGRRKPIDIIPVGMPLLLVLLALHMKIQAICLHFSLHVKEWDSDSSFLDSLLLAFLESVLMMPLFLYIGIGLMKEVDELPEQLQTFEIRKTKCFCCTSQHKHPETGAPLPCDRRVVYKQLKNWYGCDGTISKRRCLDLFDQHVRAQLSVVMRSIGGGWYITYSVTLIYAAVMPAMSLWIHEAVQGLEGMTEQTVEAKVRFVMRCVIHLAQQPVQSVLTLCLYMAMCKAGVMLTDGCSRIAAALILMIPLLFVEFLFKMPVEFFMHITEDTSLIPLIPFAFSSALALILWWMTSWTMDFDRTQESPLQPTASRKALGSSKGFADALAEKNLEWNRMTSSRSSVASVEQDSDDASHVSI